MRYAYPCVLNPEEDGGFFVVFPDVPGALTCGDDRAEALEMAADALVAILATHVHNGEDLPTPSSVVDGQEVVAVPPVPAAKLALYSAMREQGLSEAALAKQLGLDEPRVRTRQIRRYAARDDSRSRSTAASRWGGGRQRHSMT